MYDYCGHPPGQHQKLVGVDTINVADAVEIPSGPSLSTDESNLREVVAERIETCEEYRTPSDIPRHLCLSF